MVAEASEALTASEPVQSARLEHQAESTQDQPLHIAARAGGMNGERMHVLADQWLPRARVIHPWA